MPHFTLEYSAGLDARVDMAKVVDVVRKAAVETAPAHGYVRKAQPVDSSSSWSFTSARSTSVFHAWCGAKKIPSPR